jgi:very-short-patch-repair endonuclease
MNDALSTLAEAQEGMFTRAQAAAAGINDFALLGMVKAKVCRRLARGLYVVTESYAQESGAQHLQLGQGGLLLYRDAALSHETALLAHQIPVWRPSPVRARLVRPVAAQVRRQHFVIDPHVDKVVATPSGPAVDAATAVVQVARDRGLLGGVVAADHGLHHGIFSEEELEAEVARTAGWPRSAQAQAMLKLVDPRSESVGESRLRVVCTVAGIALESQVVVVDDEGQVCARVDFLVKGTRVVLEFDGRVKYAERGGKALWDEKKREDRLRRLGYVIVRVTWADLENPQRLLSVVRAAIRQSQGSAQR